MNHDLLRGFLQIGIFVGGGGLFLALFQPRDSAEFVVSIMSACLGGALIVGVVVLSRVLRGE